MTKDGGEYKADNFREAYMEFMQTPGSHNDTYAATAHRMFFKNLVKKNKKNRLFPFQTTAAFLILCYYQIPNTVLGSQIMQ